MADPEFQPEAQLQHHAVEQKAGLLSGRKAPLPSRMSQKGIKPASCAAQSRPYWGGYAYCTPLAVMSKLPLASKVAPGGWDARQGQASGGGGGDSGDGGGGSLTCWFHGTTNRLVSG